MGRAVGHLFSQREKSELSIEDDISNLVVKEEQFKDPEVLGTGLRRSSLADNSNKDNPDRLPPYHEALTFEPLNVEPRTLYLS